MSDLVHITQINDTLANYTSYLDADQIGILSANNTYGYKGFLWEDDANNIYHAAALEQDAQFIDITATGDIYANEYIKRRSGTDDYIRFENDKVSVSAGGVAAFTVEDDKVYTGLHFGIGTSSTSLAMLNIIDDADDLRELIVVRNDNSGSGAIGRINIGNNLSAYATTITKYNSNHSTYPGGLRIANESTAPIYISAVGGVSDFVITSAGKIGINTTTASAQLSINGGCHVGGTTDPGDDCLQVDGYFGVGVAPSSSYLGWFYKSSGTSTVRIETDGYEATSKLELVSYGEGGETLCSINNKCYYLELIAQDFNFVMSGTGFGFNCMPSHFIHAEYDDDLGLMLETTKTNGISVTYYKNDARIYRTGIDANDYFDIYDVTSSNPILTYFPGSTALEIENKIYMPGLSSSGDTGYYIMYNYSTKEISYWQPS